MTKSRLTLEDIDWHEFFEYREDGSLIWKFRPLAHFSRKSSWIDFNNKYCGKVAGCLDSYGYLCVRIRYKNIDKRLCHRIIWEMFNGRILDEEVVIDHINGDKANNRIENLRVCSAKENSLNKHAAKGYYLSKRNNKWQAQIALGGKNYFLGIFERESEARKAYLTAKKQLHGTPFMPETMQKELHEIEN